MNKNKNKKKKNKNKNNNNNKLLGWTFWTPLNTSGDVW